MSRDPHPPRPAPASAAPAAPVAPAARPAASALRPALAGWPHAESPFHDGERAVQARAGVAGKIEGIGRRMIRAFLPDEHRELFEKLPYLVAGAVDDAGQPWATMLTGEVGFVRTPDEHTLQIGARPLPGDPIAALITAGRSIGLLGIELATRRRNRANGEIVAIDEARSPEEGRPGESGRGFAVAVRQSFGNCPQYIQARRPLARIAVDPAAPGTAVPAPAPPQRQGARLDDAAIEIVRHADTFFLATATPPPSTVAAAANPGAAAAADSLASASASTADVSPSPAHGVDVSHRGGPPGFILVEQTADATLLTIPDYRGNYLFNSLGNLALFPRAGLLFPDFATGALLSLTAEATVSWDDPRLAAFPGAQRLLHVRITSGTLLPGALPWRWSEAQLAPQFDGL